MNHEEHDDLWNLLGKARQPKTSTAFAANVIRAVRSEASPTEPAPGFLAWLRAKWLLPVSAGAVAAILAFVVLQPTVTTAPGADPLEGIALAAAATRDIVPSLDTLLASEDNSIWLAGDPSSLY